MAERLAQEFKDIDRKEFAKIIKDNDLQLLATYIINDYVNQNVVTKKYYGIVDDIFNHGKNFRVSNKYKNMFCSFQTIYLKVVTKVQFSPSSGYWRFRDFFKNNNIGE